MEDKGTRGLCSIANLKKSMQRPQAWKTFPIFDEKQLAGRTPDVFISDTD